MRQGFVSVVMLSVILTGSVMATFWDVPDYLPGIQAAIDDQRVQSGDTLSLWGYGEPPFTFDENVDFGDKSLCVLNRSYQPGRLPQYPPDRGHVTVAGVAEEPVFKLCNPEVTGWTELRGLTITGGDNVGSSGQGGEASSEKVVITR